MQDTRLGPFKSNHSQYRFAEPDAGPATVSGELMFRRAFLEFAEAKS